MSGGGDASVREEEPPAGAALLAAADTGVVVLDGDGRVVWSNDAATRYLGVDGAAVRGLSAEAFAERAASRLADGAAFVAAVTEGGVDAPDREIHVVDGPEDRWLERRTHPIEDGEYAGGRVECYVDVSDQKHALDRLDRRERTLRAVHDVLLDRSRDLDDRLDELLDVTGRMLGADHAAFARFGDGRVLVENVTSGLDAAVAPGHAIDTSETIAGVVSERDGLVHADDATDRWPDRHPVGVAGNTGLDYYVGVPVAVEGEQYGVLSFAGAAPKQGGLDWELTLLDITANSLGHELANSIREDRAEEQLLQARREFESLVQDVEDYAIFRLDTDGHVESWNRGAEEIKGYESEEIIGEHVRTFHTEADREIDYADELLDRARERGRAVDTGWRVRADGSRIWVNAVITALHDDDGELLGFLKVTRDMTERRAREKQLEHERERLEFVNRIIRHNLLNGMNVVEARANILEGHVDDEVAPHLATIQERVEDMTDLIETMRTFMKAIVEGEEHEAEPMALDGVLEDELAKADRAYDDATFEHDALPEVPVLADDLLPEVFENLLTNAVQHNEGPTARVRVETEVTDDEVVVRVLDDGPGIDESVMAHVFEKGQKGFESPGTGFGLYLVHEIVDSYGGRVEATNREAGGAAFTVGLPRP
ncbi:PAS domain S-box protein [Haloarchaeobius salinus]|uniref:PAS domain S-box protein n=1 Tax=Haloarchaeobius salinus TaxID=1198298 RepID=UPI00210D755F